jgi:hypothetical protein
MVLFLVAGLGVVVDTAMVLFLVAGLAVVVDTVMVLFLVAGLDNNNQASNKK